MSVTAVQTPTAQTLLRLGRVSNLPTVWTNVIAGATIANASATIPDVAVAALSMTAFYIGGMYLNDFFDREIDARERPGRPIHAGAIGAATVSTIAVNCGTPTPATMRVVQIEPGPMPTLIASAPASTRARAPSAVATLPAITWV